MSYLHIHKKYLIASVFVYVTVWPLSAQAFEASPTPVMSATILASVDEGHGIARDITLFATIVAALSTLLYATLAHTPVRRRPITTRRVVGYTKHAQKLR